jgi:MFS family permease
MTETPSRENASTFGVGARLPPGWLLGACAVFVLMPATLPVAVLRGLVHDRFGVSEFATSTFMSINMVGALIAAPIAGALADRSGRHRRLLCTALAVDGLLFLWMTAELPFWAFMTLRFFEGAAHITALSVLLSVAAEVARHRGRGRVMGFVGAGLTLGVAIGAPIGGRIGREDPLLPLAAGAAMSAGLALVCAIAIRDLGVARRRPGYREIVRLLRAEHALWVPLAYAFVDRFTVGFFTTTFSLWMKRVHDLTPDRVGILLGLFLVPFSLLSYPFGRLSDRVSRAWMLGGGSLVYGLGLVTLGLWSVEALPFVMVGLGVVSAVMFVPSLVLTTELARPEIRSTALGGFNAAGSLGFMLGPVVGGGVSAVVAVDHGLAAGYPAAFAVAGAAEIACVLLTLPALRRLK